MQQLSDTKRSLRAVLTRQPGMLRLHRRELATQVLWYRHRETGRRLVLIANMHMGEARYWEVMRARIAELQAAGWGVQREGIRRAPDAAWAGATALELEARRLMRELYEDQPAEVAARLGWVFQREGLPSRGGWDNADLTDREIIAAAGAGNIVAFGRHVTAELAKAGRHAGDWLAALYPLRWRQLARPHDRLAQSLAGLAPEVTEVLLPQRSRLAAVAADPARDWALIWGAAHAGQIGAELDAAGWELTGRRKWIVVGTIPSLPASVAAVTKVAAGVLADTWRAAQATQDGAR